jgi:hypothetical protein
MKNSKKNMQKNMQNNMQNNMQEHVLNIFQMSVRVAWNGCQISSYSSLFVLGKPSENDWRGVRAKPRTEFGG